MVSLMLESVGKLSYAIVLCDDIDRMKVFCREFFPFPVVSETETRLALGAGHVLLALRKRERSYDGRGGGAASSGVGHVLCYSVIIIVAKRCESHDIK